MKTSREVSYEVARVKFLVKLLVKLACEVAREVAVKFLPTAKKQKQEFLREKPSTFFDVTVMRFAVLCL